MEPVLTVGVINYNQGHFINTCLDSIRNQTFKDFELFIIDDHSTDDSVKYISNYISEHSLECNFIINKENQGICKNLNYLLKTAQGKYLTFIAADDWGDLNRFETMVSRLETAPDDVSTIYSDALLVNESGESLHDSYLKNFRPDLKMPPQGDVFADLLSFNFIPAMATVTRTQAIVDVGGFDENLKFEDFDLWLKLADKFKFLYTNDSKCYYRILPNSLIRTLGARKWEDLYAIYEKYLGKSPTTDQLVLKMLNKCLANLYFTDSVKFKMKFRALRSRSADSLASDIYALLSRAGLRGSVYKKLTNKIVRRKID
ncbi:MAG TPA: glycosyltransferase [Flavitalea sp.]|nr:glycosyltransferase [Flavitalea sp.]